MICGCSEGGNEIDKQNPKEDTIELSQNKLSFDISREKQSIYVFITIEQPKLIRNIRV